MENNFEKVYDKIFALGEKYFITKAEVEKEVKGLLKAGYKEMREKELVKKAYGKLDGAKKVFRDEAQKEIDKFLTEVFNWLKPNGEELTEDVKVIELGLLSFDELMALFEKYELEMNYTMMKYICVNIRKLGQRPPKILTMEDFKTMVEGDMMDFVDATIQNPDFIGRINEDYFHRNFVNSLLIDFCENNKVSIPNQLFMETRVQTMFGDVGIEKIDKEVQRSVKQELERQSKGQ